VSRSPVDAAALKPSDEYLDAWQRLAKLIQQGRSFSGRERNCCFLNMGDGRFADVSGATDLDLIDDGRTLAVTDWDHDGDLDLWLANRTSPRVRMLRNDVPTPHHYLALRLIGDPRQKCNRDGVGARVEVHLPGTPPRRLIRTLYAGDAFLSQSSKWLHFGLGDDERIERLLVRWPGQAKREEFVGVAVDGHWIVRQGSGEVQPWKRPVSTSKLTAARLDPLPLTQRQRVRLTTPVEVPNETYLDWNGHSVKLYDAAPQPLLINLWASWCRPCLKELREFSDQRARLREAGLSVLALNIEALEEGDPPSSEKLKQTLLDQGVSFPAGFATQGLVDALDQIQRDAVYRQRPLPLPSSFLLDARHRVVAIYKGPVAVDQLIEDVRNISVGEDPRRARDLAIPLPGRWATELFVTNPIAIGNIYLEGGYPADARDYLQRYLAKNPVPAADDLSPAAAQQRLRLADVYYLLGKIARVAVTTNEAVASYRQALRLNPRQRAAHVELGALLTGRGDGELAARHLLFALKLRANDPDALNKLGVLRMRQGRTQDAIDRYRAALKINPNWLPAANNLAWIRATHPQASFRDAAEAVRIAHRICRDMKFPSPSALDTLAAAQAEGADFAAAIETAQRAFELDTAQDKPALAQKILARIELYRGSRPYRTPVASGK
jgi:tetratricopeptide (TPR) repeat protein/peroxiredoxin